eukprot:2173730-Pleurochrysis_carterae.AAC.1
MTIAAIVPCAATAARHSGQREFVVPPLEFDMREMIPDLLHVDSLSRTKLMFKHFILRHADSWCRARLSIFFAGLRRPIDLGKKDDGRHRAEKWWRASTRDSMVQGTSNLPGSMSAWLPTVCFIIIDSYLEARKEARRFAEVDSLRQLDADASAAASTAASGSGGAYSMEADSDQEGAQQTGPTEGRGAGGGGQADIDKFRVASGTRPRHLAFVGDTCNPSRIR